MRHIRKGQEPQKLVEHRLTPHAAYANLPSDLKDELQERLAREQGFLCCYCMQRIHARADGMKIEHWAPQSTHGTRELDWKNLLGACLGNEGKSRRDQHCDTRKGHTALTINPTDERCERLVHFLADGTTESREPAVQADLSQTLNLNHALLKNNRKAVLDAFQDFMRRKYSDTNWPEDAMRRALAELQQPDGNGMLQPYCQVPIYWLRKRMGLLRRSSS